MEPAKVREYGRKYRIVELCFAGKGAGGDGKPSFRVPHARHVCASREKSEGRWQALARLCQLRNQLGAEDRAF